MEGPQEQQVGGNGMWQNEMDTDMATARMRNHDAPVAKPAGGPYENYGLPRPDPAAMAPSPRTLQRRQMAHWVAEEEEEQFVPTEAEKDAAERVAARAITTMDQRRAAKEPMRQRRLMDMLEEEELEEERPDLNAYFNDFPYPIPDKDRISICSKYAAYIKSLQPPPPPRTKKAKK